MVKTLTKHETRLIALASLAIDSKVCVSMTYNGLIRTGEVHAIGTSKTNNLVLRVFQTDGDSTSDKLGWKLVRIDEIQHLHLTKQASLAPRPGYAQDDRGMIEVIRQL